jgi:cell wall assembly regulator SMI1
MGVTLPDDVRACYRIHDGQDWGADGYRLPFLHGGGWLSLKEMVADWRVWKSVLETGNLGDNRGEPDGPIRPYWWHPAWIPVATGGIGVTVCLDLDPAPGGSVGQIVEVIHDEPGRELLADSFTEWLEQFADDLEDDLYEASEEYAGGLIEVEP